MIFQCSDLERALGSAELMPDARAHAETCERCRRELRLWAEISRIGPQLHVEWESPELWAAIENRMAAQANAPHPAPWWRWSMAAAAAVLLAAALLQPWRGAKAPERDFLTERALEEVQQAEAAYTRSIEKLSTAAGASLDASATPLAGVYREKLLVLDAAIADLKTNVGENRYNVYLRNQLAMLYREKQKTLQEWTDHAKTD
jgi:hypothetical protein